MAEIVRKSTIGNPAFWVSLSFSLGLLVAGFIVPPTGEIPGSVLSGVGELFGFATLEVVHNAIKKGVDAQLKHGKTELNIGDMNQQDNEEEYHEENQ